MWGSGLTGLDLWRNTGVGQASFDDEEAAKDGGCVWKSLIDGSIVRLIN